MRCDGTCHGSRGGMWPSSWPPGARHCGFELLIIRPAPFFISCNATGEWKRSFNPYAYLQPFYSPKSHYSYSYLNIYLSIILHLFLLLLNHFSYSAHLYSLNGLFVFYMLFLGVLKNNTHCYREGAAGEHSFTTLPRQGRGPVDRWSPPYRN
jgi:hypothetical protein